MRHIIAVFLLMCLLISQVPAQSQEASAQSEESQELQANDISKENALADDNSGSIEEQDDQDADDASDEASAEQPADDEDSSINEDNCERVCPRFYRPLCVSRDGVLITYTTSCEFANEVRCAVAAQKRGVSMSDYEVQYNGACKK